MEGEEAEKTGVMPKAGEDMTRSQTSQLLKLLYSSPFLFSFLFFSTTLLLILSSSNFIMLRHYLLFLCALVISVIAVPTGHQYEVHERREYNTDAWTETQRLTGDTILPVRIGLTQSNLDRGHDLLMDMYEL